MSPEKRRKVKLAVQSVKRFKQALDDKGIRSTNGKLVDINGQETSLDYDDFLNDFGRNINKPTSFLMSYNNKREALKILPSVKFPAQSIETPKMRYAYNSQTQFMKEQMLKATTPKKRKEIPPDEPSTSGSYGKMKKRKATTWEEAKRMVYDDSVSDSE